MIGVKTLENIPTERLTIHVLFFNKTFHHNVNKNNKEIRPADFIVVFVYILALCVGIHTLNEVFVT